MTDNDYIRCEHSRKPGGTLYRVCKKCGVRHSDEYMVEDSYQSGENSDNDYIRAAVELADGFWWKEDCVHVLDTPMHYWSDALPQTILDALAAQLERQVEAQHPMLRVEVNRGYCAIRGHKDDRLVDIRAAYGPDRTMNTLKCIVDSGVLRNA